MGLEKKVNKLTGSMKHSFLLVKPELLWYDADESFRHLGREEVDVLNACVGAKIAVNEGKVAIDVCLAIQKMNEEAAQKERISTLFANIKNLMGKMGWSAEQSMDVLSVSDSDRKELWQLLK